MELVMDTVGDQYLVDVIVTMHVTLMMIAATTRLISVERRNLLPDPVPVSFLVVLIYYNFPVADLCACVWWGEGVEMRTHTDQFLSLPCSIRQKKQLTNEIYQ